MTAAAGPAIQAGSRADDWRLLAALGIYRLLLAVLLIALLQSGYAQQFIERMRPQLFQGVCLGYAVAAVALLLLVVYRTPRIALQAHIHFGVDVAAVTLLVYSSSGVSNGLGMLLLTPAVGCSLILTPRMALLQAATATLAMFGEETIRQLRYYQLDPSDYTQTGILGLMFFATGIAANAVAQRARKSEALAERVGSEFADLSQLNQSIVESMQTGVIVVDAQHQVRMVNAAAKRLLGVRGSVTERKLSAVLPQLSEALEDWLDGQADPRPFSEHAGSPEVLPRFTRLGWSLAAPTLILLDDAAVLREHAQQMKLAALGRLSAGIAHEIRNPLSAITHAGQLIAESPEVHGENQRLLGMIQRHAGRIDKIVKDVMELTRRDAAQRTHIGLKEWLLRTCALYQEAYANAPRPIELLDIPPELQVRFDPNHLQQVLFNLWDNCFEHGTRPGGGLVVLVHAGRMEDGGGQPYLDVSDNGPGIPADLLDKIFEPFFTTSSAGTGLGLYLSRELCEYNQARLVHLPQPQGACFRIVFVAEPR
ncbi:MAG TPA: ATP-binding protein [Solimonas sp.]|nr:ATP-binding protein [Solimonas sp.]